jgi:hypothetical protein
MDARDGLWLGEKQVLIAAFVLGSAKISGGQFLTLEHGSHAAIEDSDAGGQEFLQKGDFGHEINISNNHDAMI